MVMLSRLDIRFCTVVKPLKDVEPVLGEGVLACFCLIAALTRSSAAWPASVAWP
jgi:hypothetical protein